MNLFIETLNHWGGLFLSFAWPMLWQSSLLTVLVLAVDFLFRDKLRASLRYTLWLVVLVKLCLPPMLALPTSPAWWLHKTQTAAAQPAQTKYTISYDNTLPNEAPTNPLPAFVPPKPTMTIAAWSLVFSMAISIALFGWLTLRWWQIARKVRFGSTSQRLNAIGTEAQKVLGIRYNVPARITLNSMSPAVCGLFRPTILIPEALANSFSDEQLRVVLLHELIHVRRFDVWANVWQALLQIAYWWHPLVWLANSRIRRVREEAVDDAVMLALRDDADSYAPTLLEVAKLSLNRATLSLGLVGILESRHSLRQRIERLLDFRPPRHAGPTLGSALGILAFSAIALPMGDAPAGKEAASIPTSATVPASVQQTSSPSLVTNSLQTITNNRVKMAPTPDSVDILAGLPESEKSETVFDHSVFSDDKLSTRIFKLDTIALTFRAYWGKRTSSNSVPAAIRNLARKTGVNWDSPPGKMMFFNEGTGLLFVKAPRSDLDTVEDEIKKIVGPQLHIKARFIEAPIETAKALEPSLKMNYASKKTLYGILTSQEYKAILRSLDVKPGVETLAEPEVTTISGRQTQMRATSITNVLIAYNVQGKGTDSFLMPQTEKIETGPVIDVVPYVLADGYTVYLCAIPSETDFLGYDKSTTTTNVYTATGERVAVPTVLPRFTVQQSVVTANLWDGQTLVLEPNESIIVGGQPTATATPEKGRQLLVFVTVDLVDTSGNKLDSAEDLPFAQVAIPSQQTQQ